MAVDSNVGMESGVQSEILKKLDTTNYWFVKSPGNIPTDKGTGVDYGWDYYLGYDMSSYTRKGKLCLL